MQTVPAFLQIYLYRSLYPASKFTSPGRIVNARLGWVDIQAADHRIRA